MWPSGCRLGIQEGEQKRKKNLKEAGTDELNARVIGDKRMVTKNRRSLAVPLPYENATSLASLTVVELTQRIALIEEGHRGELVGS